MVDFTQDIVNEITRLAQTQGLEPAVALAVVEVESNGRAFEADGITPVFLFEKHVFHRLLREAAPSLLARAEAEGLAIPSWQRSSQYADQGRAGRLGLLQRARAIHEELANRSASWGLGQIMGFNAVALGYASATDMVASMATGATAQIEAMLHFIAANPAMMQALRSRDWAGFAYRYNGKGYAANRYDTRLETAYGAWAARLRMPGAVATTLSPSVTRGWTEMERVQEHLARLGYPVGKIDGLFGPITSGALFAFQVQNGLSATGQPDDATLLALAGGLPMPVAPARAQATPGDLYDDGVPAIVAADNNRKAAIGVGAAGILGGLGAMPGVGQAVEGIFKTMFTPASGAGDVAKSLGDLAVGALPYLGSAGLVPAAAVGAGLFLFRSIAGIAEERVADRRKGFERNSPSRAVFAPVEHWRG